MKQPKPNHFMTLLGGLLPVIAFTVIEETYGTMAGLIAGMIFGLGEICFEFIKFKKVQTLTWVGNGLILILGFISLYLDDGIWFKLQPALFELIFVIFLWGSLVLKKPLLIWLAENQGHQIPELAQPFLRGLTGRLGFFFMIHFFLAVWSALYWTTAQWALLKGVGLTLSLVIYLAIEILWMKKR